MTALDLLKELKNYIESNVCASLEFQEENSEEYVHPKCYIAQLPNANFNLEGFSIPCVTVGLETGDDDANDHTIKVRLIFATYGGGYHLDDMENKTDIPDGNGYIDLINFIEITKQALLANITINGKGTINKPFNYGIYDDMPYPYWYGYLRFDVNIPTNDYIIDFEREGIL